MRLPLVLACLALLVLPDLAGAGVRRCVKADGTAYYTDKACSEKPVTQTLKKDVAPVPEAETRVEGGSLSVLKFEATRAAPAARSGKGGARGPAAIAPRNGKLAGGTQVDPNSKKNCGKPVGGAYHVPC